jgi:hypothetical protein
MKSNSMHPLFIIDFQQYQECTRHDVVLDIQQDQECNKRCCGFGDLDKTNKQTNKQPSLIDYACLLQRATIFFPQVR